MSSAEVFVDPAVSRAKFDREVAEFRAQQAAHHKRGIWLLDATFPEIFVVLMATKAPPFSAIAMFGVVINFANYDIEPPSVKFVHPLTREPLRAMDLAHDMRRFRKLRGPNGEPTLGPNGEQMDYVPLIAAHAPQQPGFVCLPGVREYHVHPAHTGDSWWLHRGTGEGRLAYLVNTFATYGIDPVEGLNIQVHARIAGFAVTPRPE